jgi:CubicO group peptidase (beta-lactamase class C family)
MSDTFGDVQFEQLEVDEEGKGVFKKLDPAPYRKFVSELLTKPVGTEARIRVTTGEIIQKGKSSKGRGKAELSDARAFQQAASELDRGLRVGWRHQPDGTTLLRMMIQPKRVFSDETAQKRNAALDRRRLLNAESKLQSDPSNPEYKAKVEAIRQRLNGNPAVKPAPAAKATK